MAWDARSRKPDPPLSAALLESLLGSAPVIVAFVGPDRRYLTVSDGLARLHGSSRDQLFGRPVAEVLPDLWPQLDPLYTRVLDHGETVSNVELQHRRPDTPHTLSWLASYYPVRFEGRIVAAGVILVDITELRHATAALRESEKRLGYALQAASEGMWDWNIRTGETYYSEALLGSLGYSADEIRPDIDFWHGIVHPEDLPAAESALGAHLEGRANVFRCENRLRMKSGAYRWYVHRGKVVERDDDGRPVRMVGTDTDITERKEAEAALRQLKETLEARVADRTAQLEGAYRELAARAAELERLLRFRSEFLANMSHELRTPLNSLLILSRMLGDNPAGNLTDRQVQYARTIQASGEDLLKLIDDILDFTKTESGAVSLHYEAVALADVTQTLQRTFRHIAEQKGIEFLIGTSAALPPTMEADSMRVRQILTNLVSNAFKFTERGRVAVNVCVASRDTGAPGDDMIAFEVADTGIGIAPEQRELIFEAFRQADAGSTRKYGGTGLGLAISRQLATAMGGSIELSSELGKGSTFTVYLPRSVQRDRPAPHEPAAVAERPVRPHAAIETATAAADTAPMKVLVVDDDARNRFSLAAVLEEQGYKVLTAESGQATLEALNRQPDIRCVLIDVMMPDMDGYETTRRIRAQRRFEKLPVIAVTAKAMAEDFQKCMESGCTEYLAKPVDIARLLRIVQNVSPRP
ncbi:MAG TPA: ATP-binding protein [Burkholderiales bacterium]|nr:ATP-binding protein [Burkholderiales bacterium]